LSKKILITGGTGFIGYHLAKKCLSLNWSVTSLSTKKPSQNRKLEKSFINDLGIKTTEWALYNQLMILKKMKKFYQEF